MDINEVLKKTSRYIDNHCHLYSYSRCNGDEYDFSKVDSIVKKARGLGVVKINAVSTSLETAEQNLVLKNRYKKMFKEDYILLSVGIQPRNFVDRIESVDVDDEVDEIENFIKEHKDDVVAVGEIGLDGKYKEEVEKKYVGKFEKMQHDLFPEMLRIANKYDLGVNIHSRRKEEEVLEILESNDDFIGIDPVILHSFQSPEQAHKAYRMGYHFSMAPEAALGHEGYENMMKAMKEVKIDAILTESDGSTKNNVEPSAVIDMAKIISDEKGLNFIKTRETLFRNAKKIYFHLKDDFDY